MTIKTTLAAIKAAGMHGKWDADGREYRVTFRPDEGTDAWREEQACYTPDADDAIATAKAMRAHSDANWDVK